MTVRFLPGPEGSNGHRGSAWRSFVRRQSAWGLEQEGDLDGAERVLTYAFAECPADLEAALDLCGLLLRRGRRGEAVRLLAIAERGAPHETGRVAARLAELHAELGDPRSAVSWYARALEHVGEPTRGLVAGRVDELTALLERTRRD